MRKFILAALAAALLSNLGHSQTVAQPLLVTNIFGVSSTWAGECAAGIVDNRSAVQRQNDYNSVFVTSASGNWTVAINYSDTSCAGPWTTFGSASSINQASSPAIAYGQGYHPFIQIAITGNAVVTYSASKNYFLSTSTGSTSFPITAGQGGTGTGSPGTHAVAVGQGSSPFTFVTPGVAGTVLTSNGASADPTFQASTQVTVSASTYNFTTQTPSGALTGGIANTVTINQVLGVNGTDVDHYLWIGTCSGGAQYVKITGGTAVSSTTGTGTLTFTPTNSCNAGWTLASGTAGVAEAQQANQVNNPSGTNYVQILLPGGTVSFHAPFVAFAGTVLTGQGRGATTLAGDLSLSPIVQFGDAGNSIICYNCGIMDMTVSRLSGAIPANSIALYFNDFARAFTDRVEILSNAYGVKTDNNSLGLTMTDTTIARSSTAHLWLKDMEELYANNLELGINAEGATTPTYLIEISGGTNSIQAVNCRLFGPGGSPATYAIGFTGLTGGSGGNVYFAFDNCNVESVNSLLFSDATVSQINYFQFTNSRLVGSGSSAANVLNANTTLNQWMFAGDNIAGFTSFNLTNVQYLNVTNSIIAAPETYTGGAIASGTYSGNVTSGALTFTGAWNNSLAIYGNTITGGSFTISGVTGNVQVRGNVGAKDVVNGVQQTNDLNLQNSADSQTSGGFRFRNSGNSDGGNVLFQGGDHNFYQYNFGGGYIFNVNNGSQSLTLPSAGGINYAAVQLVDTTGALNSNVAGESPAYSSYGNLTLAQVNAGTTIVPATSGRTIKILGFLLQAAGGSAAGCTAVQIDDTTGTVGVSVAVAGLTSGTVVTEATASNVTLTTFLSALTASQGLQILKAGSACTTMTSLNYRVIYTYQ